MEDATIETPPQPSGERAKLVAFWAVMAIVAAIVVLIDSPYELGRQSSIMVKSETVGQIRAVRGLPGKTWPVNEKDADFQFGPLARAEHDLPRFEFRETARDKTDPKTEIGIYQLIFRGKQEPVRVRFNPTEKPKRRLF